MVVVRSSKRIKIIRSFERIIFLYGLLFTFSIISAQTYYFDNYSVIEGLEQSKVYSILQDDNDYIWLGTKGGVSKFDGINFINYTIENGLAGGGVRVIYEDSRGTIWLGHENGGLTRFVNNEFEIVEFHDTLITGNITSFAEDADKRLWLTTAEDGVYVFFNSHDKVNKIEIEHFKGKRLSDRIFSSLFTSDSVLFFVTDVGIKKYNKEQNNFENYVPEGFSTYFITAVMFEDSRKNLWFGTYNGGLIEYIYSKDTFIIYDDKDGLATNWISAISEDSYGNIWVGHWSRDKSKGGISKISEDGVVKVFNTHNGLHDNQIFCIMEDKEGNILIGTTEHGLEIFKGEQFVSFSTENGLINDQVWAVTQDVNNNLWFGTNGGITVFNDVDTNKIFIHYTEANNYISNQIRFFRQDNDKNIWIVTADQGIIKFDIMKQSFVSQPKINSYVSFEINALEIDKDNQLWIGTVEGLFQFDINKYEYIKRHSHETGLAGNDITSLFIDSRDLLWAGSKSKGITSFDGSTYKIYDLGEEITPTCISEDKDNNIWIGTDTRGVLALKDTILKRYSISNGLLANLINVIDVDDYNNVYVGTNRGLNKIVPSKDKIYTYTKKSGYTGIETKSNASYKDSKGHLWFGTVNGVMRYNPLEAKEKSIEPLTHISRMMINGQEREMSENLKLRHNQNSVLFYYHSICLTNPEAVRYKLMLEGLESEWQDGSDQTYINYRSLPPNKYTFKVIAKNSEGVWNSSPIEYSFQIMAPFYQRAWFIITATLIIIVSIVTFIKIRERNLIKEKRVLETKVKERTLELSEAYEELELKNKDITDSIRYAKRIQFAILPPDIPFDDTFIFFKPKDIVSGDFYWITSQAEKEFFAAVDCTGHGVPGAFMSFIGYTSLNKIVIENGIHEPAEILNRLNEEVATALHQKGEEAVRDGMDLALISYAPKTRELQYAGAFNPLFIIQDGEMNEIKANRFAIGRSTDREMKFTNHKLKIKKGDSIYIFSDGYSDQFGGPDCKKFKTANLRSLLLTIYKKDMEEQRAIIEQTYEEWKGDNEQIDDIIIVGRRFN